MKTSGKLLICCAHSSSLPSLHFLFVFAQGSSESVDGGCKSCGSGEVSVGSVEVIITSESSSCTCPAASILHSPKTKKGKESFSFT